LTIEYWLLLTQSYKFRADYVSYQFWSSVITVPGTYSAEVVIEEETAEITVTVAGEAKEGVKVYVFNEDGTYLGIYGVTDDQGKVSFDLPVGLSFKFRADHMASQYWSDTTVIGSGGTTHVSVDTGGGVLTVTVQKDPENPINGINVYLFSASGTYLGYFDTTDGSGQVSFTVSQGDYKVRADYLSGQFWSDSIAVNDDASLTLTIPHQDVVITVQGDYDGNIEPREGLNVYLFTPSGTYLGISQGTDTQGRVVFNLPEKDYKVRADYLTQQYWSGIFNWTDETITIDEGMAEVTVTNMGLALEGINVYVFNSTGTYLGLYDLTGSEGNVSFRLPQGDYNFRADYMANQYWSGISTIIGHVENPVNISTGGGSFTLTVNKGEEDPLVGVSCYLFSESGTYLGENGVTNDEGDVDFNLADGTYKIRADYLSGQFWSDVFVWQDVDVDIDHGIVDVHVTFNGEDVADAPVYLFTASGSYLGRYEKTGSTFDRCQLFSHKTSIGRGIKK